MLELLAPLRAQRNRVFSRNDSVDVAIDLPTGVEMDAVVDRVAQQISVVASYLSALESPAAASGSPGSL